MKPIHLACCAVFWAAAAQAEAPLGTIAATLDGEARTWVIATESDGGQSWTTVTGPVHGVGLWAAPEGGAAVIEDVIDMTFTAVVQGDIVSLAGAEMRLLTSDLNTYYTATGEALEFAIERFEPGEAGLAVSGTFSGDLARTTFADGAETSDPGDTRDISGRFEAILPPE